MKKADIKKRLEYLRGEIEAERISTNEIVELGSLAAHIDPSDVLLLAWAGVPEYPRRQKWKRKTWKRVPDNKVRHIWTCAVFDCKGRICKVTPDWYQQNGTPMCPDCNEDMEYMQTEVKI